MLVQHYMFIFEQLMYASEQELIWGIWDIN